MTPKKDQNKRKRGDKGKQSMPSFPYDDGSVVSFNSEGNLQRFKELMNIKILTPRFLDEEWVLKTKYNDAHLGHHRAKWFNLFGEPISSYQPLLIQAFYSNMEKDEDGDLVTTVNGTKFFHQR